MARGRTSLVAGLGIVVVGSLLLEISRLNTWDEAWFLQVATRLSQGDVLYREVFFGTTPLAAYLAAGLVTLFGPELVVLKLAGIACIAGTFLLVLRIAADLRMPLSPVVWGAAIFLTALPYTFGYTILAVLLLLASMATLLAWHARASTGHASAWRWLLLAGALAGACVATKHNVGGLGAAALLISVVVLLREGGRFSARETITSVAAVTTPMIAVPMAILVVVLLSGGLPAAVDYAITSKFDYLEYGELSYGTGFNHSIGALLPDARVSAGTVLNGLQAGRPWVFLLPPAAALTAAWALWRRPEAFRGAGVPLLLFTAVAAASILPRADQSHLTAAAPVFLVALAYFARAAGRRSVGMLLRLGCVALASVLMVTAPLLWLRHGSQVATTAHLRGVVLEPGYESQLLDRALDLRAQIGRGAAFYLFPEASLSYLLTDVPNPTPYDFPLRTAFGTEGTRLLTEELQSGEIGQVCLDPTWGLSGPLPGPFPELQPAELAAWIREELTHVATLATCDLYASGAADPAD